VAEGQLHRLPDDVGVAPVEAAGHVGRRDERHDRLVRAQGPPAVGLAHVAVEVDDLLHGSPSSMAASSAAASVIRAWTASGAVTSRKRTRWPGRVWPIRAMSALITVAIFV